MTNVNRYSRGNIYVCKLIEIGIQTDELALIISNSIENVSNDHVIVLLIASNNISGSEINIPYINEFNKTSYILCNRMHTINKKCLIEYIGSIDEDTMNKVNNGVSITLAFNFLKETNKIKQLQADIQHLDNSTDTSNSMILSKLLGILDDEQEKLKASEKQQNSVIQATKTENNIRPVEISSDNKEITPNKIINQENNCSSIDKSKSKDLKVSEIFQTSQQTNNLQHTHKDNKNNINKKWSKEEMREFVSDKRVLSMSEMRTKYNIDSIKTITRLYYTFRNMLGEN